MLLEPYLWLFPYALAMPGVVALALRDFLLARASLVMWMNWKVLSCFAAFTGDQYNVATNMLVDVMAVLALAFPIRSAWQIAIIMTFGVGMIFHSDAIIKILCDVPDSDWHRQYYWRFSYLAWGQAALLIGWACHGTGEAVVQCWVAVRRYLGRQRNVAYGLSMARQESDAR